MGGGVRCAEVLAVREVSSRVAILVVCHALGERGPLPCGVEVTSGVATLVDPCHVRLEPRSGIQVLPGSLPWWNLLCWA